MTSPEPGPAGRVVRSSRARLASRPAGIVLAVLLDVALGDPRRGHPVALFGSAAAALERRIHAPQRVRGIVFTLVCTGVPVAVGVLAERAVRHRPIGTVMVTGVATWAALGGRSLAAEGRAMADLLDAGDLPAARSRLSHLCSRDPSGMTSAELARATVESLAENTGDAVVAPLLWAAVAGIPGVLGHRAVNTLDAMVGYRSPRYERFGWASARLDDLVNLVPARCTGVLTVLCAGSVGGTVPGSWRVLLRDGARHPSPNAGRCEAAAAGALGVRLGGPSTYGGRVEERPVLGDGRSVEVGDVRRAVRLLRVVTATATATAVLVAALASARRGRAR